MIFVGQGWSFRGFSPKLQGTYWDAALESKEWDHWIVFLFFFCERRLELTPFGVWQKRQGVSQQGRFNIYIFFLCMIDCNKKSSRRWRRFWWGRVSRRWLGTQGVFDIFSHGEMIQFGRLGAGSWIPPLVEPSNVSLVGVGWWIRYF